MVIISNRLKCIITFSLLHRENLRHLIYYSFMRETLYHGENLRHFMYYSFMRETLYHGEKCVRKENYLSKSLMWILHDCIDTMQFNLWKRQNLILLYFTLVISDVIVHSYTLQFTEPYPNVIIITSRLEAGCIFMKRGH